jgi:restriction endonuclease S subunit
VLKNLSSVALLRNIPVPLPTIKDQETIAEILSAVDEKTRVETSMRIALLGLFEALLRDLMTGVLRTSAMINEND